MKLRRYYFDKIKCGEKIYELRLNDEKRRKISIGDQILFRDHETEKQEMLVEVDDVIIFDSFEAVCKKIPLRDVGLEGDVEKAIAVYRQFYTIEEEKCFGVVAIKVKLKNNMN